MAKISELLAAGPTWSFEFFPPKTDEAARALEKTVGELQPLDPSFVSVTYGAGGSTRERTRDVVIHIERDTGITAMAHLTCVAHSREQLVSLLEEYREAGIENILALGGDVPDGMEDAPSDLAYASELVALVQEVGDFSIGVAAHPELHPRSPDRTSDRRMLAAKLLVADFAITQFFFEAHHYLRMVDELAALGVAKPVVPGIMPVTNLKSVGRMAAMSGAEFPPHLAERFEALADDPDAVRALGIELATELCAELLAAGAPGLHFYTLNRSPATRQIYENLGLGG
ncbi:MAG: methylenetetrahydrofolate reductase [NAD(P)H] [Acidimicrobiia bacterium]|nr:methylenetetrahydrofolate reductase [NAD(P)H] [Acidimicrobiia bacterium]